MTTIIHYLEFSISVLAILFAFLSALYWALSAKVNLKSGWDNDKDFNESYKAASKYNLIAAVFTALASLCSAALLLFSVLKPYL